MNQVVLVGRLTETPIIKTSENDKSYTIITLAVSRNFKNSEGVYETDFFRCILWNNVASNVCDFCKVGDTIGVRGRLQNSVYETDEEEKKYVTNIIAERVTFLTSSKKNKTEQDKEEKK